MTDQQRIEGLRQALKDIISRLPELGGAHPDAVVEIHGIASSALGDSMIGEKPERGGK